MKTITVFFLIFLSFNTQAQVNKTVTNKTAKTTSSVAKYQSPKHGETVKPTRKSEPIPKRYYPKPRPRPIGTIKPKISKKIVNH